MRGEAMQRSTLNSQLSTLNITLKGDSMKMKWSSRLLSGIVIGMAIALGIFAVAFTAFGGTLADVSAIPWDAYAMLALLVGACGTLGLWIARRTR